MLYRYAYYSRKNNRIHYSILLVIFFVLIVHTAFLLNTDNVWLFCGMVIYLPVFITCFKVSTIRERILGR